jgi:SAM-dependent methyltransferase
MTFNRLINKIVRKIIKVLTQFFHIVFGSKYQCNICGYRTNIFESDDWYQYIGCKRCGSSVRQRLLWALIKEKDFELIKNKTVLHFAPDKCLVRPIKKKATVYHTADFLAEGYVYKDIDIVADISNMPQIKPNTYDTLISCDVLEHVPDDKEALNEIFRVLKPGGICLLTVPQKDGLQDTYENSSITTPSEREKEFGQADHLRIYGLDFKERLKNAGFEVQVVDDSHFDKVQVIRNVLKPAIPSKHPLATNIRRIYLGFKPLI